MACMRWDFSMAKQSALNIGKNKKGSIMHYPEYLFLLVAAVYHNRLQAAA